MPLLDISSFIRNKESIHTWKPWQLKLLLNCAQTLFAKITGDNANIENPEYSSFGNALSSKSAHSNCFMNVLWNIFAESVQGTIAVEELPTIEFWPKKNSDTEKSENTLIGVNAFEDENFYIAEADLVYSIWGFEQENTPGNMDYTESACCDDCRYCSHIDTCTGITEQLSMEIYRIGNGCKVHDTFLGSLAKDIFDHLCETCIYTSDAYDANNYPDKLIDWMSYQQLVALGELSTFADEDGSINSIAHPTGGAVLQWLSDYHDHPQEYQMSDEEKQILMAADNIIQLLLVLFEKLNNYECTEYMFCPIRKPGVKEPYSDRNLPPTMGYQGVVSGNALSIVLFYNEIYFYGSEIEYEENHRGSELIAMSLLTFLKTLDFVYHNFSKIFLTEKESEEQVA